MPQDRLQDLQKLRATISARLHRFWTEEPESPSTLRESVAAEIAAMLRAHSGEESPFLDNPDGSLPLGARLRPRGVFEDRWDATPSPAHPWPVILLHGTTDSKGVWQLLGTELRLDGWTVFAPDYGTRGTEDMTASAAQIGAYITAVLHSTGAEQVIIIGHSQGGLLARYWMKRADAAAQVKHLICIGSPNHGTTNGGILSPLLSSRRSEKVLASVVEAYFGTAGTQQIIGSAVFDEVNGAGDLLPGVGYTCIATKSDAVVVPPESCFLDGDDGQVRNIFIQDFDHYAVVRHDALPTDKRTRAIVRSVLADLSPSPLSPFDMVDTDATG